MKLVLETNLITKENKYLKMLVGIVIIALSYFAIYSPIQKRSCYQGAIGSAIKVSNKQILDTVNTLLPSSNGFSDTDRTNLAAKQGYNSTYSPNQFASDYQQCLVSHYIFSQ